jgi:hypothetical protein
MEHFHALTDFERKYLGTSYFMQVSKSSQTRGISSGRISLRSVVSVLIS